jgi:hypothetical protein
MLHCHVGIRVCLCNFSYPSNHPFWELTQYLPSFSTCRLTNCTSLSPSPSINSRTSHTSRHLTSSTTSGTRGFLLPASSGTHYTGSDSNSISCWADGPRFQVLSVIPPFQFHVPERMIRSALYYTYSIPMLIFQHVGFCSKMHVFQSENFASTSGDDDNFDADDTMLIDTNPPPAK